MAGRFTSDEAAGTNHRSVQPLHPTGDRFDEMVDALATPPVRSILAEIYEATGTPADLSDRTGLETDTVTDHLGTLEEYGLVHRPPADESTTDPDHDVYAPVAASLVLRVDDQTPPADASSAHVTR